MNWTGIISIYLHEMDRMRRTTVQSVFSPVISSSLYFVVFGAAIGSRIPVIEDISYGSFIVPGMIMLALLTQSVSNASSGIFFPKFLALLMKSMPRLYQLQKSLLVLLEQQPLNL